jgi:hypothetical protein
LLRGLDDFDFRQSVLESRHRRGGKVKSISQTAQGARRSHSLRWLNTVREPTGLPALKRAEAHVTCHIPQPVLANESQRDSGPKPPWANVVCDFSNPNGVATAPQPTRAQPRWGWRNLLLLTQGSSYLATLGWVTQSHWDWPEAPGKLWVMKALKPALRHNEMDSLC